MGNIREVWYDTRGPFLYDDADTYPDAVTFRGIRARSIYLDADPTAAEEAARKGYVDGLIAASDEFTDMTDTPENYTAANYKLVRVNNTPDALEFATLAGTENQVVVTHAAGSVTLSLPQDYDTGATPTLGDLTISTPVNIYALSHDSFADFAANKHIDWTAATSAFSTTLTGHFGGNLDTDGVISPGNIADTYIWANASTLGLRTAANDAIFFDAGGLFSWRDRDDSDAVRMTLNSATGALTVNGRIGVNVAPHNSFAVRIQGIATVWEGGIAAGGDAAAVALGELSGVATIGGHNAALSAWGPLYVNYPNRGAVSIGGDVTTGGDLIVGGDIGPTADPDLLQMVANELTVNGSVGIGTASPGAPLHIQGTTFPQTRVQNDDVGSPAGEAGIRFRSYGNDANAHADIGFTGTGTNTGNLVFRNPHTNVRMTIASDGAVTIGGVLQTGGYKSSDGSAGITQAFSIIDVAGQHNITFKNGILTAYELVP